MKLGFTVSLVVHFVKVASLQLVLVVSRLCCTLYNLGFIPFLNIKKLNSVEYFIRFLYIKFLKAGTHNRDVNLVYLMKLTG